MNVILTASKFLFTLITFPYISRVLLAEGNGKVTFAASIANYFLMVASLGIPTYGIRACAKVRDDKEELSQTAQEILIINLIATILVTITYVICVFTVPRFRSDPVLFLIEGINLVLNAFGVNWLYQALEQYDYITKRYLFFQAVSVALMLVFVHQQSDYRIYALITVLASAGANVLNFIKLRSYISLKKHGPYHFKRHIKPIFILFAQSITASIYTNLDTVMLGFMKGDVEVGLYDAAVRVKSALLSIVTSLGSVLLPRMSYYARKDEKDEFIALMKKGLQVSLLLSFPLTIYFILEAKDSILFLAGDGYLGAVDAMRIITLTVVPIGLTNIIGVQVLTPLNQEKYVLYSVMSGAVSDFILNLFMIPGYGAAGAAVATVIAEFLVLAVQVHYARHLFSYMKSKWKALKYPAFALISGLVMCSVYLLSIQSVLLRLILTVIVYFGVYAILLWISKDDLFMNLIHGTLHHKKQDI